MSRDAPSAAELAALIGPLSLASAQSRRTAAHGRHARRRSGAGTEFWQFRTLELGEAAARIDWRRSARSDDLYVREREQEDPVRLLLWADGSGSMHYASAPALPSKAARAHLLLQALALAATEAEERVDVLGAERRRSPLADRLQSAETADPSLQDASAGDVILLAGDFLEESTLDRLAEASDRGATGILIKIADPAEAEFPFQGRVFLTATEDSDPEADIGRADRLRSPYLAAWQAHLDRLSAAAEGAGWPIFIHRTDEDPVPLLGAIADRLRAPEGRWAV
ncbi:DUF58 domain-containing protein [Pacificimonas flava]|uniref:DUF58 domain-containing protein n=1 Tax=Pacificimonas flava TaxID=1234595 RepID=UPI0004AFA56B|nr:DUF58 domain-containing protein [Pacificimonas flava]MBB5279622.1 uncharacterized protein (DUF58 family) [Pacificimonas flava]